METKICSKCRKEKPLAEFKPNNKSKDGRRADCYVCHREWCRVNYRKNHPEVKRQNNGPTPPEVKRRNFNKRYPTWVSDRGKRECSLLLDGYIKCQLSTAFGVSRKLITQEVIELKRAQMQIKRATKQLMSTIKEKQDEYCQGSD